MSILVDSNTRIMVQGITGRYGGQHTKLSLEYGTKIVAGVTPGKGGQMFEDKVPIYNTAEEAAAATGATVSVIFVPPTYAADAILEAAAANLEFVVCITEFIPIQDMIKVKRALEGKRTRLLGWR